jgi:hypothetical protein
MNFDSLLSTVVINRTGIVLNFFAGFLIAPELIGLERLRKLEENLERFFGKIKSEVLPIIGQVTKGGLRSLFDNIYFAMIGLFLTFIILTETNQLIEGTVIKSFLGSTLGTKVIFLLNLVLYIRFLYITLKGIYLGIRKTPKEKDFYSDTVYGIVACLLGLILFNYYFYLVAAFSVASQIIWLVILAFTNGLSYLVNRFIKLLEGDSSLKHLLIPLGVTFYILGNVLQFIGAS